MDAYYKSQSGEIYCGDVLETLKKLPEKSVNMCITSPPYWGLRDYGTAEWEGGDEDCEHIQKNQKHGGEAARPYQDEVIFQYKDICPKCGAVRKDKQLGLESTPEEYVEKMVEVFREVRRVLKDDGTCWLNLGDSYYNFRGYSDYATPQTIAKHEGHKMNSACGKRNTKQPNLKGKDLVGIPWMVAFALRNDGWYLRQDIIWHKPNPMPESVTDRCTKSHEYIFLLSKNQKYFYDADAIKEKLAYPNETRRPLGSKGAWKLDGRKQGENGGGKPYNRYPDKRNKRSVWTVNTKPYKEAHFAVFPPKIPELCIKAGSKKGDVVLDPFFGSGTTGWMARKLGRKWIGIELNSEYIEIAKKRLAQGVFDF